MLTADVLGSVLVLELLEPALGVKLPMFVPPISSWLPLSPWANMYVLFILSWAELTMFKLGYGKIVTLRLGADLGLEAEKTNNE